MLILSRQRDETIMIGDNITITIVDIRGSKVRLAINAPKNVPVHRKEVYAAIRREQRAAQDAPWATPEVVAGLNKLLSEQRADAAPLSPGPAREE